MPSKLILTNAGLDELIAADQSGTDKVAITECGFGSGQYTPSADATDLASRFKTLTTVSGGAVAGNIIHIEVTDGSSDAYTVYEAGLYSSSGTLIALVSQTTPILQKAADSTAFLAFDIKLDNISADVVEFGDTTYINPQATETVAGVAEIATQAEVDAGSDDARFVTPKKLLAFITAKLSAYLPKSQLLDRTYPVGAVYISTVSTSPATLFGGTWVRLQDRFLYAGTDSGTYAAGNTGGEKTTALTLNQIPAHAHAVTVSDGGAIAARTLTAAAGGAIAARTLTAAAAGAHDHGGSHATSSAGKHGHGFTTGSGGAIAARTLTAASGGAHTHTRGTMDITGTFSGVGQHLHGSSATRNVVTGAFYYANTVDNPPNGTEVDNDGQRDDIFGFQASKSWTGSTSNAGGHEHDVSVPAVSAHTHTGTTAEQAAHAHTVTVANQAAHTHNVSFAKVDAHTHSVSFAKVDAHGHAASCADAGGGAAHNNMPPYLAVYMWKRTA